MKGDVVKNRPNWGTFGYEVSGENVKESKKRS